MKINKAFLITSAVALAISAGAVNAAPNVANVTQKGSLIFLPKIDATTSKTTLVNVVNDGDSLAYIKGYYVDGLKNKKDLLFTLTAHQSFTFDVKSGKTTVGSKLVPQFPTTADSDSATGFGELVLWVTDSNGIDQLAYNHIAAKATVVNFVNSTAFEYQGWAFYSRYNDTSGDGLLLLNGSEYDFAPQYLLGGFIPKGAIKSLGDGKLESVTNTLDISSATQDLRQDYLWHVTKLDFDIWNGDEVKYTNAYRNSDSVFQTALEPVKDSVGVPGVLTPNSFNNGTNFLYSSLGTETALFRVQGNKSTQADKYHIESPAQGSTPASCTTSESVGLVGVLSTEVKVTPTGGSAQTNIIGTALNAAGYRLGSVLWDTGFVTPEKK